MKLVIISGRSGSGKSSALNLLADIGYYCIDNLPASLLPTLVSKTREQNDERQKHLAVCIDSRNAVDSIKQFPTILDELPLDLAIEIIFFDANTATLLKRFSETRRRHPLTSQQLSLREAIEHESELLVPISAAAHLRIDTTQLSIHDLRKLLKKRISYNNDPTFSVLFESFGFKHGAPIDADFIFDVRCLPNPYWHEEIRDFNGLEQPVIDYLSQQEPVQKMCEHISRFLDYWLPAFKAENRSYMTIAIGCTGGKHRSVFITEQLAKHCRSLDGNILVRHRELD